MKKLFISLQITPPIETNITFVSFTKTKIIIIDNGDFFISIFCNNILAYEESNSITILNQKHIYKNRLIYNYLKKYLYSWEHWFFVKIKFKGKGYRIRKKKKLLKFFFWFSHMNLIKVISSKIKKIGKERYILLSTDWNSIRKSAVLIRNVRKNDLFTKRGLRLARQIIIKKKSRKISYMK